MRMRHLGALKWVLFCCFTPAFNMIENIVHIDFLISNFINVIN